jgi:uncharacterized protein involved in outer membrane biogenesis
MSRLIRWALRLFILLVILVVAAILLLNTAVKQLLESRLRTATGMDAEIGSVDVGLLSPTMTIDNFKLYNTADFGGSIFIDMPELHIEYDPFALRSRVLHFTLVRLNLAEISLIQDKKGRLNVQGLENSSQAASKGNSPSQLQFTGIDTFNLTLGKFRMSNLANGREQEIDFGIKNQILHNVKSQSDLAAINLMMAARGAMTSRSTNGVLDVSSLLRIIAP